jgi:hypothetical protein
MSNVQVFRREVPPISVRDLDGELDTLSELIDAWANCDQASRRDQLFRRLSARLNPKLMKALVMIAQKQTRSLLKNREKVRLAFLGRVRLFGVTERHFMQWIDVLVAEDGTPLLRRVALSEGGMEFYSFTWAGCTSLACVDTERWDSTRKQWIWDSAGTEEVTTLRRDGVLPYLPLHMSRYEQFEVFDWERQLAYSSMTALLQAVDRVGKGTMDAIERAEILKLLTDAQADMNPLWSHLAREAEFD